MSNVAQGTFDVQSWDESVLHEVDGSKVSLAKVIQGFHGDIEGQSSTDILMAYPSDDYASCISHVQVTGTLAGRRGSFTLQATGEYRDGKAGATWFVVPGSGTGELVGLRGEGGYPPQGSMEMTYRLEYSFE